MVLKPNLSRYSHGEAQIQAKEVEETPNPMGF